MADVINLAALTANPEEARQVSEAVFEKSFSKPALNDIHFVQTGVEMDRYIPIFGNYGLVGKIDPGSCASNVEAGQIPVSQKTWLPKLISFRIEHCQADVPTLFKLWKKARIAANTWSEVNNEMMAFVSDKVQVAIDESIIRIAEFADTTNSPVGDATGNQLLTAGTTKTYFNMLNGMWSQIFTDGLGAKKIFRYTINENTLANKTAQDTLPADAALNVLRGLYNGIDPSAFDTNMVFQISRSLFSNWQDMLEDKSLVFMLNRTEEGATVWSYRGIPIVVRNDWDRIIRTYFNLGDTNYYPHRAVLSATTNIPIGTSDSESLTMLDSFFDKVTKKHYIDAAYKVDCKILVEKEIAVAY